MLPVGKVGVQQTFGWSFHFPLGIAALWDSGPTPVKTALKSQTDFDVSRPTLGKTTVH